MNGINIIRCVKLKYILHNFESKCSPIGYAKISLLSSLYHQSNNKCLKFKMPKTKESFFHHMKLGGVHDAVSLKLRR